VLRKTSRSLQRRQKRHRRQAPLRHTGRCPAMTSSLCQLTWCDKVADSGAGSGLCHRASFCTPFDRRRHHACKSEVDSRPPPLFATPTSGAFVDPTHTPLSLRTPTYDFVFDVDMTRGRSCRSSRHNFRSPCCPTSCHVTPAVVDCTRSNSPSPTDDVIVPLSRSLRYVEGNDDDDQCQPEVKHKNNG